MYLDLDYIKLRVKESDLIDLTRDQGEEDTVIEPKIEAIIIDASSELDNSLNQAGYITPVSDPSDFIKRLVFDIFLYYLYARKYDDEEMKDVYVRYNKAYQKLNQIAKGELYIPELTKATSTTPSILMTNKVEEDRIFVDLASI